jgi:hypothetical protein
MGTTGMVLKPLIGAELEAAKQLYARGCGAPEVIRALGLRISTHTLRQRLKEAGVTLRGNPEAKRGTLNPQWKGALSNPQSGRKQARDFYPTAPSHCQRCQKPATETKRMERHHRDEDPCNNAPDNIEWVCASCHRRIHWAHRRAS